MIIEGQAYAKRVTLLGKVMLDCVLGLPYTLSHMGTFDLEFGRNQQESLEVDIPPTFPSIA